MHKDKLMGKYVMYMARDHKYRGQRLGKVVNIVGNTLTIIDGYREKHRVNRKTHEIFGVLIKRKITGLKKSEYLEDIEWN